VVLLLRLITTTAGKPLAAAQTAVAAVAAPTAAAAAAAPAPAAATAPANGEGDGLQRGGAEGAHKAGRGGEVRDHQDEREQAVFLKGVTWTTAATHAAF